MKPRALRHRRRARAGRERRRARVPRTWVAGVAVSARWARPALDHATAATSIAARPLRVAWSTAALISTSQARWLVGPRVDSRATPVVAEAVGRLGTEGAFAVLARARALEASGRDVIHLEIGEPDFETPAACRRGRHRSDQGGRDALLPDGRACRFCARRQRRRSRRSRGLPIAADDVLVANGAKPFLFFTVLATCGPGDEVDLPRSGVPDLRVGRALRGRRRPSRCRSARSGGSASTRPSWSSS